jgi:hypothetical protein
MIKDIALALEVDSSRDAALDYAVSVAATFNAHIAAIGFAYEPVMPPIDSVSAVPFDILDAEREESRKAAMAAISRFEETARRAAVYVSRVSNDRGKHLRRPDCLRVDSAFVRLGDREPG